MKTNRASGYAPIEEYAALGDGRTVALVAADGAIDWWPVSRMDATPTFCGLLDAEHGGAITVAPTDPFEVERCYLTDTNVVETTFTTSSGTVRLTDAVPLGRAGQLSWSQLVRRIEGIDGKVPMAWSVRPGTRFATTQPWVREEHGAILLANDDELLAVQNWRIGDATIDDHAVTGEFSTKPGSCGVLTITGGSDTPVVVPECERCLDSIQLTTDRWREWAGAINYDGPWQDAVRRSALALKLLAYSPTGAIAAAPTTSLPERIGGEKNWDYRFMWVRDAAFTIDALLTLDLQDEAHAAVKWMLGALRRTAPELRVFYTLDGQEPDGEHHVPIAGYRESQPVRAGNRAARQVQLGTFGDLFDMIWLYVRDGHRLDTANSRVLTDLADRCCDVWLSEDSGIWELTEQRHYTVAKIGCWTALDRAVKLGETGQLDPSRIARWAAERERVKGWVNAHCWSESKRSYTSYAGTEDLDAATLLAARTGFEQGKRMVSTIEAIRAEGADGPLVYRFTGASKEEGAFLACSFWLVNAMVLTGQRDAARDLMDSAVALTNDVGLLAEQIDAQSGAMLGNFPQGLSHLAMINAACAYTHTS